MAEFTVNPTRYDPYKTHMFRVKWDNVYVAGLSKMGPLTRVTAPVSHRVGGDPTHPRLALQLLRHRRVEPPVVGGARSGNALI